MNMFLFRLLLVFVAIVAKGKFENPAEKYSGNFIRPCFDEDMEQELASCSDRNDGQCDKRIHQKGKLQLVRLDGIKTGYVREVDLAEERNFTLITRAMKPLIFDIPQFLSNEESDHIIHLAKQSGLTTSIAGFNQSVYNGDLEKELSAVDQNYGVPSQHKFAAVFSAWDKNKDNIIDTDEIKNFIAKYVLLFLQDDEIDQMFEQLGFYGYENGAIGRAYFGYLDIAKLFVYLKFMKMKHPRHRARFSEQAWLHQNKNSDPVLRRLHERVIKLTKLPREIIQGGEALQVVQYEPHGHYHVHLDSMPITKENEDQPCCHHKVPKPNGCRLCRFITILYYLNDVQGGGETAFIVADNVTYDREILTSPLSTDPVDDFNLSVNCKKSNLLVHPKKGRAIMWYNHFIDQDSGLLGDLDPYSLHGGCDVTKGEKWIANNWITAPQDGREHLKSVYDVGFD